MTLQTINIGTNQDDGTGDLLRDAFDKINDNFTEVYTELGGTALSNITMSGSTISTDTSNSGIIIDPQGTGTISLSGNTTITGTATISSTLNISGATTMTTLGVSGTTGIDGNFDIATDKFKVTASSGDTEIAGTLAVTGAQTFTGQTNLDGLLKANGSVDLGNATSDTITVTGRVDSDLLPSANNTHDLGSSSLRWDGAFFNTMDVTTLSTGSTTFGSINIAGNKISSTVSNANITLDPSGTGSVEVIGNITLADSGFISLGGEGDLTITHDGDNSIINDTGTGKLIIKSSQVDILGGTDGGESMATFVDDGAVTLFFNNSSKLATSNTGISITGNSVISGSASVVTQYTGTMYLADSAVLLSDSAIVTSDRDGNVLVGNVKGALTGAVTGNVTGNLTGTVLTGEQASITTAVNLTTTGALNAGTITSGFGDIDNGTSTINSSGNAQLGKINITDADSTNLNVDANTSTADTFAVNLNVIGHATLDNLTVSGQIYGFTSTATLKTLIAASADFADFQARFARIQD
tara:strand:+ start:1389 stop:2966 length:1578 start_codon:yes stop_codon:yes gene_type:complete